jgi:splicing factor 3B subunit 4
MNGQYLMNKQVSVQYAYKKDGKGERHGDEAERMLSAQARKHNVQPPAQQPPPQIPRVGPGMVSAPGMSNGDNSRPLSTVPPQTPDFGMNMSYQNVPPPNRPIPPPTPSLNTPPPGLPARPPPSQAGYGGPQSFLPPGFAPPALRPPAGAPQLPPGFQQPGYGGNR